MRCFGVCLGIKPFCNLPERLLLHSPNAPSSSASPACQNRQDKFAVLSDLFVGEGAERIEKYSIGSFVGLGGSSECNLKFSFGHVWSLFMAAELLYFKRIAVPCSAIAVESRRHWTGCAADMTIIGMRHDRLTSALRGPVKWIEYPTNQTRSQVNLDRLQLLWSAGGALHKINLLDSPGAGSFRQSTQSYQATFQASRCFFRSSALIADRTLVRRPCCRRKQ